MGKHKGQLRRVMRNATPQGIHLPGKLLNCHKPLEWSGSSFRMGQEGGATQLPVGRCSGNGCYNGCEIRTLICATHFRSWNCSVSYPGFVAFFLFPASCTSSGERQITCVHIKVKQNNHTTVPIQLAGPGPWSRWPQIKYFVLIF